MVSAVLECDGREKPLWKKLPTKSQQQSHREPSGMAVQFVPGGGP